MTGCDYCLGFRCPCTCADDCGSRGPWCPAADGYLASLRETGLYSVEELNALVRQGYK